MRETPSNYNRVGMTLGQLGRYPAAIEAFRKAIDLKWDFAPAHHNLGVALATLGRHEQAVAAFRTALEVDPRSVSACCGLARALAALERFEEARAVLAEARRRVPDSHEIAFHYGIACENLLRLHEAEASYRRAIELNPFIAEPYVTLARLLLYALDRPEDGVAALTIAAELDGSNAEVRRALDDALALLVR